MELLGWGLLGALADFIVWSAWFITEEICERSEDYERHNALPQF